MSVMNGHGNNKNLTAQKMAQVGPRLASRPHASGISSPGIARANIPSRISKTTKAGFMSTAIQAQWSVR